MPAAQPVLTETQACDLVTERGFGRSSDGSAGHSRVGIELEWIAVRLDDPSQPASFGATTDAVAAAGPLPGGSKVTFEPGGQLELSSPPLDGFEVCDTLRADLAVLHPALADAGVGLVALGLEPGAPRARMVHTPRYDAMEAFFDETGDAGRTMMRSTAALQVNLDYGDAAETKRRWRTAHDIGPVLAAAFANSPLVRGLPTGWRSTRLAVWSEMDADRCGPVCGSYRGVDAWAHYALAARVMLVRRSDQHHVALTEPLDFAGWIRDGHPLGWPTGDDLEYHLTTLFPPVRPRGWLELRMMDAVPDPWWRAAAAVSTVLVTEAGIADCVERAVAPVRGRWLDAARHGLAHPELRRAARECFASAYTALAARGADGDTLDATSAFLDRYVARGRCPADDRLEAWWRDGTVIPTVEGEAPAWI